MSKKGAILLIFCSFFALFLLLGIAPGFGALSQIAQFLLLLSGVVSQIAQFLLLSAEGVLDCSIFAPRVRLGGCQIAQFLLLLSWRVLGGRVEGWRGLLEIFVGRNVLKTFCVWQFCLRCSSCFFWKGSAPLRQFCWWVWWFSGHLGFWGSLLAVSWKASLGIAEETKPANRFRNTWQT